MTYSHRKAEQTDGQAVYKLYCLVMRGYISKIWSWNEQWQKDDFTANFDHNNIMLVYNNHELIGYSHVENRSTQLYIRMIVIHPKHQQKGIGSKLLKSVIMSGKEQSKSIELQVFKINDKAKEFYVRHGFTVRGENTTSYILVHS
ncbi:MAG: GNAT family N-acetyltransferase [Candidatus Thiodiazotropha sp. (ex Lucinoma borealis)]|nr:GNAT family N-acetyltransferase [Candidatus Thiodiazotropha sp. (ex Lucinoma borealis)]